MEQKWVGRTVITLLFVFSLLSISIFHKNVKIKNNLLTLYDMKGQLLQDEITASQVIQYTPGGWYIVSGRTEDEALENEENLRRKFEAAMAGATGAGAAGAGAGSGSSAGAVGAASVAGGLPVGYVSTSQFVPSQRAQEKSRAAYSRLLELAEMQLLALGFEESEAAECAARMRSEFAASAGDFVAFGAGNVSEFIQSAISNAWLGKVGGTYYTVLLPTKVTDYSLYRQLASEDENVFFISKSQDISADLDQLTRMVLKFFLVAYVLMFIMLRFFYSWKQSLKIISVPLLIILVVVATFAIAKINLEFFSITGLILVFGLGLDYIIYMMENEKKAGKELSDEKTLEPFATMVSFVTTIISFGALALSSFKPVHLIGLSIFIGLATAYVSSFFYGRVGKKKEN